jgi:hypothetical protein
METNTGRFDSDVQTCASRCLGRVGAANALYVTAAQPPNVSVLHMAMVQGAV